MKIKSIIAKFRSALAEAIYPELGFYKFLITIFTDLSSEDKIRNKIRRYKYSCNYEDKDLQVYMEELSEEYKKFVTLFGTRIDVHDYKDIHQNMLEETILEITDKNNELKQDVSNLEHTIDSMEKEIEGLNDTIYELTEKLREKEDEHRASTEGKESPQKPSVSFGSDD